MSELYRSDRTFKVWAYTVSHTRLLLRSTIQNDGENRIDVFFGGVDRMLLQPVYEGLTIAEASAEDLRAYERRYGPLGRSLHLYRLGDDRDGFVVAGVVQWHEDLGNSRTPSYFGHFVGA
ncbi:hypothetical protein ACFYXV_11370 [Streptomyces sp. NPDC002181]|uniref:hypothetical protein n=1 Tax=unclassified Streptomyces TaxID=2593676 RepID=UPI00366852CB